MTSGSSTAERCPDQAQNMTKWKEALEGRMKDDSQMNGRSPKPDADNGRNTGCRIKHGRRKMEPDQPSTESLHRQAAATQMSSLRAWKKRETLRELLRSPSRSGRGHEHGGDRDASGAQPRAGW